MKKIIAIVGLLSISLTLFSQSARAYEPGDCMHQIYRAVYTNNPVEKAKALEITALLVNNLKCPNFVFSGDVTNVVAEAKMNGKPSPYQWSQDTVILHSKPDGSECRGLQGILKEIPKELKDVTVRCVPERLRQSPGGIEIWIVPPRLTLKAR